MHNGYSGIIELSRIYLYIIYCIMFMYFPKYLETVDNFREFLHFIVKEYYIILFKKELIHTISHIET